MTAKNAGLVIDINQLEELTGYKLTKEEVKQDTSIWNVPNKTDEKPVDKNSIEEWKKEVVVENDETVQEAVEEKVTEPSKDDVRHGASILKAFDAVLKPLGELFKKLFGAKNKEESDGIVSEINKKIEEIESSEDNELIRAVQAMLKEEFEKGDE